MRFAMGNGNMGSRDADCLPANLLTHSLISDSHGSQNAHAEGAHAGSDGQIAPKSQKVPDLLNIWRHWAKHRDGCKPPEPRHLRHDEACYCLRCNTSAGYQGDSGPAKATCSFRAIQHSLCMHVQARRSCSFPHVHYHHSFSV